MTNANLAGGSTILFATSGTITLQSALPAISHDVYMVGPGANTLSVSGNGAYQVFDMQNSATAAISGLTITDGSSGSNGGGIENDGTLTLTNCTVSDSSASGDGGGINNTGTLTLTASTVSGNTSANDAGGIENAGTSRAGQQHDRRQLGKLRRRRRHQQRRHDDFDQQHRRG